MRNFLSNASVLRQTKKVYRNLTGLLLLCKFIIVIKLYFKQDFSDVGRSNS